MLGRNCCGAGCSVARSCLFAVDRFFCQALGLDRRCGEKSASGSVWRQVWGVSRP
jgi:hypothetical protein